MNAIVAVTADWGIGCGGALLVHERADMRRFVELTRGSTVIMGRKTLEGLPGGRPLRGRRNIVLTGTAGAGRPACPEGTTCEFAGSVGEALEAVGADDPERVWCIGGAAVYRALLPHCSSAFVTKFDVMLPADAFFPDLDGDGAWELVEERDQGLTEGGVPFSFCTYARRVCQGKAPRRH